MSKLLAFAAALVLAATTAFATEPTTTTTMTTSTTQGTTMTAPTDATATPASVVTDPENTLRLELKDGPVLIKLRPDLAPNHVARIKELARKGFYNGVVFHRVIEGFMAQTGDPTGTGTGGSGQHINAEFSQEPFKRGTVGMARAMDPNSADSQFFINFADTPFLNGQYTVVGQVFSGMEFVDKIARGEPPATPDKIVKLQVEADAGKTAPDAAMSEIPSTPGEASTTVTKTTTTTEEKK